MFNWIAGQYQYSVGNPVGGTFTGILTSGSSAITSITSLPTDMIVGSNLSDLGNVLPVGTNLVPTVPLVTQIGGVNITFNISLTTGATAVTFLNLGPGTPASWPYVTGVNNVRFSNGDIRPVTFTNGANTMTWTTGLSSNVNTLGNSLPNLVLMSVTANATPAINPDTLTYTVPGNIPMGRPLRFRQGFTRSNVSGISSLDYTFTFTDFDNYKRELLKNVQGPWPYIAAYQPTFPYGQLYVYPAPGTNYSAHIFSDMILSEFTSISAFYSLPQGYSRSLKKLLGLELSIIYGKTPSPQLVLQAKEAKKLLQGTNSTPVGVLQFDSAIARSQVNDASWITHGGFT